MPRNTSGVYSLPIPAYVAGTTIKSADMNSNLSDIATALTGSVAANGVTPITGPIVFSVGSLAAPSITFLGSLGTGLYLSAANQIAVVNNGNLSLTFSAAGAATFVNAATFNSNVSVGGNLSAIGNLTITGTGQIIGACQFDAITVFGNISLSAPGAFTSSTVFIGSGASHAIGTVPDPGASAGTTRFLREDATWQVPAFTFPTAQKLTVGSGNYTPTAGTLKIRVVMVGPGGGGGAQATNSGGNGSAASSFGTWTANAGNGGSPGGGAGGAGGSGGTNGTGNLINRITGGNGQSGITNSSGVVGPHGGQGGTNALGGAGAGAGSGQTGIAAAANTGAGGGGAGANGGSSGAGGGAGEYVEFWVNNPGVIAYVVGAKGAGGNAGTVAGGAGADGVITVEEFYF